MKQFKIYSMNKEQDFLISILPSDLERVEIAMLVSNTTDTKILTDIVATVDLVIDKMKQRAGIDVEILNAQSENQNVSGNEGEKEVCVCPEPKYNYPEMVWCDKCGKEIGADV